MSGRIPLRTCVGCGEEKDKSLLIRVSRTPEGGFIVARTLKKAGRGAYLCDSPECLAKARKKRAFNKSFGQEVPESVYKDLERCISAQDPAAQGGKEN